MEFIDYYKVLGVSKEATQQDIKKAYRKLARQHHPDLHPDDEEAKKRFQMINEAHEVLKDPENRKKYDEYGEHWKHAEEIENQKAQQAQSGGWGGGHGAENFSEGDFSRFFESVFGQQTGGFSQANMKFRGGDLHATMELALSEVLGDHKRTFEINGQKIRITVLAGVDDGQIIKLNGYGQAGVNGGPAGDLFIKFLVKNDLNFKRKGSNLFTTVDIPLTTAVLGGEQLVDTLSGQVKLKITPGSQSGTKVRLKGKGLPIYKSKDTYGDLFVEYNVNIPTDLSRKQRELFEEFQKEEHGKAA